MQDRHKTQAAHVREHRSLLAAAEKRMLIWIAGHLPQRIHSDHLSLLGFLSMLGAGAAFAVFPFVPWAPFLVVFFLVTNWFGDSLDGTLARLRRQERPRYGYYVDHVIDIAGTAALLSGLAASGLMTPLLAMALLAAYAAVCAETYLATHSLGVFRMAVMGFGPTELRILLAAGALKAAQSPDVTIAALGTFRLFDIGAVVASAGLAVVFLASAVWNTRRLYLAEPMPVSAPRRRE